MISMGLATKREQLNERDTNKSQNTSSDSKKSTSTEGTRMYNPEKIFGIRQTLKRRVSIKKLKISRFAG